MMTCPPLIIVRLRWSAGLRLRVDHERRRHPTAPTGTVWGRAVFFPPANTCFTVEFPAVVRSETKNREHARVDSCLCAPADFRTRPWRLAWRLVLEARV